MAQKQGASIVRDIVTYAVAGLFLLYSAVERLLEFSLMSLPWLLLIPIGASLLVKAVGSVQLYNCARRDMRRAKIWHDG